MTPEQIATDFSCHRGSDPSHSESRQMTIAEKLRLAYDLAMQGLIKRYDYINAGLYPGAATLSIIMVAIQKRTGLARDQVLEIIERARSR